jgi:hypothetical protein
MTGILERSDLAFDVRNHDKMPICMPGFVSNTRAWDRTAN